MSSSVIEAKEINIRDLFNNRFFEIPIYQRPLSWADDNFRDLVDDINDAIDNNDENYFIGTILLKKIKDANTYEVVDGQQRLTSLVILLAVFRDYLGDRKLQKWISSEADEYAGIPAHERINVWNDLQDIFSKYIYKNGGSKRFVKDLETGKIEYSDKNSPIYHLYEAIKCFQDFTNELNEDEVKAFLNYLFKNVYFVHIITDNRSSAFRLFNVINTRGLPLSAADVLKSMNLEYISDDRREEYFRKWREIEEDIGREELEKVISYIRTIFKEEKSKKEIVEEFEELFEKRKISKGKEFFDILIKYVDIYNNRILNSQLNLDHNKKVKYETLINLMTRFLPFFDWVPPLLLYYNKFGDQDAYDFVLNLEKKFVIEWYADFTSTERVTSSINLIRLIKREEKPQNIFDAIFNYTEETKRKRIDFMNQDTIKKILLSKLCDSQFYTLKGSKMARYLLLRLDMEMQEEHFPGYANIPTITIEHILPRTPDEEWRSLFTGIDIDDIINKLGNLTLLNKRRNTKASNYNFEKKKEKYFETTRNPFAITTMLNKYSCWDISTFEQRHKELIKRALQIYT